jgi:hypothetical protein
MPMKQVLNSKWISLIFVSKARVYPSEAYKHSSLLLNEVHSTSKITGYLSEAYKRSSLLLIKVHSTWLMRLAIIYYWLIL